MKAIQLMLAMLILVLANSCSNDDGGLIDGDLSENEQEVELDSTENNETTIDGDSETSDTEEEEIEQEIEEEIAPFYFSVLSDTHIYISNESNNQVLQSAGELFSEYDPAIDLTVITGDVIHDLFCLEGVNCDDMEILKTYRNIIENNFSIPVYTVLGNHDNRFFDMFGGNEYPLQLWLTAMEGTGTLPAAYYSVKHKGVNLIMMFASDLATDHDTNDTCTFGEEQLNWLTSILEEGLPSVIFWHQLMWPADNPDHPVLPIIKQHKNIVKAVFFGHGHNFRKVIWEDVPFYETGACSGKSEPVYHLVKINPLESSLEIVNKNDIVYSE